MDFEEPDTMKPQLLINLFKQAVKTFTPKLSSDSDFTYNFKLLKGLIDQVRADDVKLDPTFNEPGLWEMKGKAPCTYIEIFQNQNLTISIFVLKPGFTMPLHDHPKMYGLLKVISGNVRVRCFSKINSENMNVDVVSAHPKYKAYLANVMMNKCCNADTESCLLTPEDSNFHEIESLNGPAAFLDILAPPYSAYIEDGAERQCHYYTVAKEISPNIVQLQEIPLPKTFFCDEASYLGPVLI